MNERDDIEPEPSAAELAEAEALARALERGHALDELPDDALSTAGLLRYAAGAELDPERSEAILEELLQADARARERRPRATRSAWWRWAFGLGVAAALAMMAWVLPIEGWLGAGDVRTLAETELPAPPAALIEERLARIQGAAEGPPSDERMRAYRGAVYARLEARYTDDPRRGRGGQR